MDDKKIVYQIIFDCWEMCKKYLFVTLDDFLWNAWHDEMEEKSIQYKRYGEATWHLYRDIISAIVQYKQRKDKDKNYGSEKYQV